MWLIIIAAGVMMGYYNTVPFSPQKKNPKSRRRRRRIRGSAPRTLVIEDQKEGERERERERRDKTGNRARQAGRQNQRYTSR